jgi:hypothetical protein
MAARVEMTSLDRSEPECYRRCRHEVASEVCGQDEVDLVPTPDQLENPSVGPGHSVVGRAGLAARELGHHRRLRGGKVQGF